MRFILAFSTFLFVFSNAFCQNVIQSDTEINETIHVKDTFDLEFLNGDGFVWWWERNYDSTLISIRFKSSRLMEGQFPHGGKQIHTIQFEGKKPGNVKLEFYWGRPWLKEQLQTCVINILIE